MANFVWVTPIRLLKLRSKDAVVANPFSTRYTQPGALSYLCDQTDPQRLCRILEQEELASRSSRAFQIVGPHGCGKTSLTVAIAEILADQAVATCWLTIRARSRSDRVRFDRYLPCPSSKNRPELLVVDGIESVNRFQRSSMLRHFRKNFWRVILTTHRPIWGVEKLSELKPSFDCFHSLCRQLLGRTATESDWPQKIETAFEAANGNFREAFFDLYDEYENSAAQSYSSPTS